MNFSRYRKSERLLEKTNMCISFHSHSQLISVNETPVFHFSVCPIVRILCVYACVYVCRVVYPKENITQLEPRYIRITVLC